MQPSLNILPVTGNSPLSPKDKQSLLLELYRTEPDKNIRAVFREASEKLRRLLQGWTEKEIRAAIRAQLEEYYRVKESDFAELTGIPIADLKKILVKMEAEGIIENVRYRRHHEAGKHYDKMFALVGKDWD